MSIPGPDFGRGKWESDPNHKKQEYLYHLVPIFLRYELRLQVSGKDSFFRFFGSPDWDTGVRIPP